MDIPLFLSPEHPCSYLENKTAETAVVDPNLDINMGIYAALAKMGFRRSGSMIYRQHCAECQQCLSVRIPVDDFVLRRNHRRILKANADVQLVDQSAKPDPDLFKLYQAYTADRHADGDMKNSSLEEYMGFLTAPWSNTRFLVFSEQHTAIAVAVTDLFDDGLSAVYTYFTPDMEKRSLGTYAILRQIEHTKSLGKPYLYLGFWIRDSQKMAYKANFRPLEIFAENTWKRFDQGQDIEISS